MSECVVRMPFPDDNCPIGYDILGIGYCPVEGHKRCNFMKTKERPNWCPIVCELPENHGRLVDADGLIKRIEIHKETCEAWTDEARTETGKNIGTGAVKVFQISLLAINKSPTIVPAERGEE